MVLAYTGAIKDDIMDTTELAASLMARLAVLYPTRLAERYKLQELEGKTGMQLLAEAGKRRGCLISGGEVDFHRISAIILDEFRGSKLGKVSLERPPALPPKRQKSETKPVIAPIQDMEAFSAEEEGLPKNNTEE